MEETSDLAITTVLSPPLEKWTLIPFNLRIIICFPGKELFIRSIIQSGSALSSWGIVENPLLYTKQLTDRVNCSHLWTQTQSLVQCLKRLPYEQILDVEFPSPKYMSAFGPIESTAAASCPCPSRTWPERRGLAPPSSKGPPCWRES